MLNIRNLLIAVFLLTIGNKVWAGEKEPKIEGLEHPYLFFSAEDLPALKERMKKEPFLTRWEIFKKNADEVVNSTVYEGTRARTYLENAGKTSFAYIITKDEKYARRAIEEALAIVKGFIPEKNGEGVWYNPTMRNWNKGADLNTAEVTYALAMVYDWCYDAMTDDGGGHEGIMYARYGGLFALYFTMANQRLFGFDPAFWEVFNQKLAGYWDVYLYAPDSTYANFNNMGESAFQGLWGQNHRSFGGPSSDINGGPSSDINALMENLAGGDPLLLWAADNGAPRFYWDGASPWFFLWRRGDAKPVAPDEKPELQNAVLFRGAGHAILQSDDLWLAYNAGWTSDKSHNNRDLGSFILVIDKERLVYDPGKGDGHALNHSTITINNKDQHNGRAGEYLNFGSGKSFHYLATDLSDAYDKEDLKTFIRHLLMVNDTYFIIIDELNVVEGADVEWRLQTRKTAEVLDNQNAVINGENHQLFVINAADETKTDIVPWEGKNGKLNAVSKKPVKKDNKHLLVTVLFPVKSGVYTKNSYPDVAFEDGILTVNNGIKYLK